MKLGAEPKKAAALGGLLAVAAILLYVNVFSDDGGSGSGTSRPAAVSSTPPGGRVVASRPPAKTSRPEFRPSLKRDADDPLDVATVDPSLRLDILEKLQKVTLSGSGRNLFEFGAAPPPPPSAAEKALAAKAEPKIMPGPVPPPPPEIKTEPPKPQAPPIPLKFYGYISTPKGGQRRGFFLDGDDILVAGEGDTIKKRYKVVRIGLNNVEMEDLQFSQTQTLRLIEQPVCS